MELKTVIIVVLLLIFLSLGSALVFLVRDKSRSTRTAKALTARIVLSIVLFLGIIFAISQGVITPNPSPFLSE